MSNRRKNRLSVLKWRLPVRIDVRRAALTMSAVTSVIASALVFVIREQPDAFPRAGFGWETRTGSILTVPLTGDACGRSLFDNDSGLVWPLAPVSCTETFGLKLGIENPESAHVKTVSQNFRR